MSEKVSIIIPVYNGYRFLAEAIESALAQTYPNTEIIIVNDGSDDGGKTEETALAFVKNIDNENKIRYYYKDNGGVSSALNFGIRKMTGEYFAWLSHDDMFMPDKTEKQIRFLKKINKPKAIVYSNWLEVNESAKLIYAVYIGDKSSTNKYWAVLRHKLNGCAMLIPKACFEESGIFDESLKSSQDYELWFRFAQKHEFCFMKEFTLKSRIHPGQGTFQIKGHRESQNILHKYFLENLPPEAATPDLYLLRHAELKKEGLEGASEYALKKYKEIKPGGGASYKIKRMYYLFKYNKKFSAFRYIFKLVAIPGRWKYLFKIIYGRLGK